MVKMIYDITPKISEKTAVFPGDTPFSVQSYAEKGCVVSSIQTTLHIGAHIDAPLHYNWQGKAIDELPLETFIGGCLVVKPKTPNNYSITPNHFSHITSWEKRILISTGQPDNSNSSKFSALHPDTIALFQSKGVILVGIDTPSVDDSDSLTYPVHKAMASIGMVALEGLYLQEVPEGHYKLTALPLNLQGLEASPVRAILENINNFSHDKSHLLPVPHRYSKSYRRR